MQNLKVTFSLLRPAVLARMTFFDSILSWCAVREAGGDLAAIERLPLKRTAGVYHASTWEPGPNVFPFDTVERRYTKNSLARELSHGELLQFIEDDKVKKSHLNEGSGAHKAFILSTRALPWTSYAFHCVGERAEVGRLLACMSHIGARATQGYGEIESVAVEEEERDLSLVSGGRVMRPLPVGEDFGPEVQALAGSWARGYMRVFPPYWRRDGMQECLMPRPWKKPDELAA